MTATGKRAYTSELRAAQARATRAQIVVAAATLFTDLGYAATTVDAIATAAGVSRKTVFTAVGGKAELIKLAYDIAVAGDDEPVPLRERRPIKDIAAEPDAARLLDGFATFVTDTVARVAPIAVALEGAAHSDPQANKVFEELSTGRRTAMLEPAGILARRGALREGVNVQQAADILWIHNDAVLYAKLVGTCEWPTEQFRDWLSLALRTQLLKPELTDVPR
jgi:AcrR family transcriptional regulator